MAFDVILENRSESIQKAALKLRDIILGSLDAIDENVYGGKKVKNVLYSKETSNNVICGVQTNPNYCLLYLHKTSLVDTAGLKLEGSGKHAKHVKFRSDIEIDPQQIATVLQRIDDVL